MRKSDTRFRLLLVRHAQSANNVCMNNINRDDFTTETAWWDAIQANRESDPNLSPAGVKQAEVLGNYLSKYLDEKQYEIISSPMRRTILTCQPLAKRVKKQIIVHPAFFEHYGCYKLGKTFPGSTQRELEEEFPVRCLPGMEKGWYYGHDEVETTQELFQRVERLWHWIYNELPKLISPLKSAVILGHGTLFDVLLGHLLGCRSQVPHPVLVHANIGITEIDFVHMDNYGCGALVKALNYTGHIPDEIRTGDKVADRWEKAIVKFCPEEKKEEDV